MKKFFRFLTVALVLGSLMQSCEGGTEESDNTPDVGGNTGGGKPDGGSTEAGTPKFLEVRPGNGRAEVVWLVNGAESDVKYSYFYYTNEAGKTSESLQATGKSTDTLRKTISMAEGKYTLSVKNFYESSKEYSASSEELTVDVYGDTYKAGLKACPVTPSYAGDAGGMLTWGEADDYIGSQVTYLTKDGEEVSEFCPADQREIAIKNVYGGTEVSYKSFFLPAANAIDTLSTSTTSVLLPVDPDELIEVSNLEALQPYLAMSDVNVKLKPGTYRVTAADFVTGKYTATSEVVEGYLTQVLLLVGGNNSTYDFTDVTIINEVEIFADMPYQYKEYVNLHFLGNDNHVFGLSLLDEGELEIHNRGCTNVIVDGIDNLVENVSLNIRGSYPYRYGEMFGKGGGTLISHDKHCGMLVRGLRNHILNCNIFSQSYGHLLFMQGATYPIIEGCNIEGSVSTTDTVLLEEGTGSPADEIDFMTVWGYKVPPGYTLFLNEDGIRTYTNGNTMMNGIRFPDRGTEHITVKNCYVKNARGGVTLRLGGGSKYVENTTCIGCDRGFATGTGTIKNCFSDVQHNIAFGVDYDTDRYINADITLVPYEGKEYNGPKQAAYIRGNNHNIRFRRGVGLENEDQNLSIQVGGDARAIGSLAVDENAPAYDNIIINETYYPMILDDNSHDNTIYSLGKVENHGTNNKVFNFIPVD